LLSGNGEISRVDAISMRTTVTKLSDIHVRKLLETAVSQGLLQEGGDESKLYMGPKMQAELKPFLRDMEESVGSCKVCNEVCIRSLNCNGCGEFRVHKHCGDIVQSCRSCGGIFV
jgi:hypothetical protein